MKPYIQTERGFETTGTNHRLVFGIIARPTRANSRGKTLTAAAITIAIALAFYGLVLTDIGPMQ